MELEDMLEDCVQNCGGKLNAETILTDKNAEMVKAYLMDHWNRYLHIMTSSWKQEKCIMHQF